MVYDSLSQNDFFSCVNMNYFEISQHNLEDEYSFYIVYEQNNFITELETSVIVDIFDNFYHKFNAVRFTIHTYYASLVWLENFNILRGRWFRLSLKLNISEYEINYESVFSILALSKVSF